MRCRRPVGLAGAVLALLALLASSPATSGEIEGVRFDDRIEAGGDTLELHGLALLRYRVVFRAYVAGLYLRDGQDASRVLDDVPKRLELSYFWGIAGADFGPAADQVLERSFPSTVLAPLRERLDRLHALYRDVEPGDRYALTYIPGRGTELALNGTPLGTIEGADFAAAYFAIWLGRDPIDASFRDTLLAGRR